MLYLKKKIGGTNLKTEYVKYLVLMILIIILSM